MDDFQIEPPPKQSNEILSSVKSDKNTYQSQSFNPNSTEDSFNLPMVILAWVFKIISIVLYLTLRLLTDLQLEIFVISIIFASFDFWVTKNLTGKKLVGLRWFSQINENGQEQWIYESRSVQRTPHSGNVFAFWVSQIVFMVFWIVIFIVNFITLSLFWIGLGYFCAMLAVLNFACYFKCRGEHQKKAKEFTKKMGLKAAQKMF